MKVTTFGVTCFCLVVSVFSVPLTQEEDHLKPVHHEKYLKNEDLTDMSTAENIWPIWGPGLGYAGNKGGYYPTYWFPPPALSPPIPGGGGFGLIPLGGSFGGPLLNGQGRGGPGQNNNYGAPVSAPGSSY